MAMYKNKKEIEFAESVINKMIAIDNALQWAKNDKEYQEAFNQKKKYSIFCNVK